MDISIRRGETLIMTVVADDATADTVNLMVADDEGNIIINETENFTTSEGVTSAEINTNDTDYPVGDYEYMLTVTYEDGTIEKLPDTSSCGDDCDLPLFKICESIMQQVS